MPSAVECLRWCKPPVLLLETVLDNTLAPDWGFEDMPGGLIPVTSFDDSITFADNSQVRISTGKTRGVASSQIVINSVQFKRELSERFSGGSSSTLSKMSINHRVGNAQFYLRDWAQKNYKLKVGGKFKPNTAYADILRYQDYPIWIMGRTRGKSFNEKSMQIAFDTEPVQLSNLFPENKFTSGVSEGKTIPFVIGHVRIMAPVPTGTGETTGKFHDGDCEGVVAAYDLAGNTLTLESGDPTTDTVSAADKYMSDNLGNVAWHSSVDGVVAEFKGARINGVFSDKANELIAEMVRIATSGSVPVNHSFDGKQIGWVFYEQASIKDQVRKILDGIDCFYSEVEQDNSITIRRRYNARAFDLDGNANVRDSFDFGESDGINKKYKQVRAMARPKQFTLLFNQNFSPLSRDGLNSANRANLSRRWDAKSNAVHDGREPEKVVECAYTQSTDAENLSRMIADIYGLKAFLSKWEEPQIGLGLREGDAGVLRHALIQPNVYSEILDVTTNVATHKTSLTAVVYG